MISRLLRILDSTPSRPKNRTRGQSLVEIAVTTPILFLLITGLMEVGFLAANYIILTDALRTSARFGVTQDITQWKEDYTRNAWRTVCYGQPDDSDYIPNGTLNAGPPAYAPASYMTGPLAIPPSGYGALGTGDPTETNASNWRIFDGVACQVINNMQPLGFDPANDDIAVSLLSYTGGDPSAPTGNNIPFVQNPSPYKRYPLQNSFCNPNLQAVAGIGDDITDYIAPSPAVAWAKTEFTLGNSPNATADGTIRGFILTGNMKPPDSPNCLGSYFYVGTPTDNSQFNLVYQLRNSNNSLDPQIKGYIAGDNKDSPNGGLIIAEILWHHHILLGFPPFNLLQSLPLHLWSIFPQFSGVPPLNTPGTPY